MKCKHCNGKGRILEPFGNRTIPAGCPICGGTGEVDERINKMLKKSEAILNAGKPKPMTNEEWLDSLPSKDKAIWLTRLYRNSSFNELAEKIQNLEFQNHKTISALIEGWLKEKHDE